MTHFFSKVGNGTWRQRQDAIRKHKKDTWHIEMERRLRTSKNRLQKQLGRKDASQCQFQSEQCFANTQILCF